MSSATPLPCHDWNVYAYECFADEGACVLHTESYPYGASNELVDIEFEGVVGHQFECVLEGNILFDIVELGAGSFVEQYSDLLERLRPYGFPSGSSGDWRTPHDFEQYLQAAGLRCFVLHSSYGMWGFVLARSVRSTPRPHRYTRASWTL